MSEQRYRLQCGYVTATRISTTEFNDWGVQFHDADGKTRWREPLPASMFESVFERIEGQSDPVVITLFRNDLANLIADLDVALDDPYSEGEFPMTPRELHDELFRIWKMGEQS